MPLNKQIKDVAFMDTNKLDRFDFPLIFCTATPPSGVNVAVQQAAQRHLFI